MTKETYKQIARNNRLAEKRDPLYRRMYQQAKKEARQMQRDGYKLLRAIHEEVREQLNSTNAKNQLFNS
jgi:hypothetical protein